MPFTFKLLYFLIFSAHSKKKSDCISTPRSREPVVIKYYVHGCTKWFNYNNNYYVCTCVTITLDYHTSVDICFELNRNTNRKFMVLLSWTVRCLIKYKNTAYDCGEKVAVS